MARWLASGVGYLLYVLAAGLALTSYIADTRFWTAPPAWANAAFVAAPGVWAVGQFFRTSTDRLLGTDASGPEFGLGVLLGGLLSLAGWAATYDAWLGVAVFIDCAAIALIATFWNEIARAQRRMEHLQATTETAQRHQALMKQVRRRNRQRTGPHGIAGRPRRKTAYSAQA